VLESDFYKVIEDYRKSNTFVVRLRYVLLYILFDDIKISIKNTWNSLIYVASPSVLANRVLNKALHLILVIKFRHYMILNFSNLVELHRFLRYIVNYLSSMLSRPAGESDISSSSQADNYLTT